jgi:hypothetical protein
VRTRRQQIAAATLGAAAVLAVVFSPARENPPIDRTATIDATTELPDHVGRLLRRACYDCHSHETRWPWYSALPPASWLVAHDVNEGRGHLNFSRWATYNVFDRADMLDDACELVSSGEMPLPQYRWLHPDARLADPDVKALCAWARTEAERLVAAGQ